MNVFLLIRTSNEVRRTVKVVVRNVHGVYEDPVLAQMAIPHWANETRKTKGREVYAAGANEIEFTVERWEVQTFD